MLKAWLIFMATLITIGWLIEWMFSDKDKTAPGTGHHRKEAARRRELGY